MENTEYMDLILRESSELGDFNITKRLDKNQIFNNFLLELTFRSYSIKFVDDRFFIEVEMFHNDKYVQLYDIEPIIRNLSINYENIDKLLIALKKALKTKN